jgi:hypothetical protein
MGNSSKKNLRIERKIKEIKITNHSNEKKGFKSKRVEEYTEKEKKEMQKIYCEQKRIKLGKQIFYFTKK